MAAKLSFAQSVVASAWREWRFLRRDAWEWAQMVWLPCLLMGIVVVTFSGVFLRQVPIAVVDADQSPLSRSLIRKLDAAPGLSVSARPASLVEAWPLLRRREVYALAYLPPDLTRQVARGETASVVAYYNASYLATGQTAGREIAAAVQTSAAEAGQGRPGSRPLPVRVQSTAMFNPERSYEHFLVGLLLPAVLHLGLAIAVTGALGRELRDGSAMAWLDGSGQRLLPALLGKILPYLLLFTLYGVLSLAWLLGIGGDGLGVTHVAVLLAALVLLYLAYAGLGLLLVGVTRSMTLALSAIGVVAGGSLAFSGATFPVIGAALFTRIWSAALPFTAFTEVLAQQLYMRAPVEFSLWPLGKLLLFALLTGTAGVLAYGRAARDPSQWGQR